MTATTSHDIDDGSMKQADYALIFNAASNGMAFTRHGSGDILDVNASWIRMTGIPREQAIGKTAFELGLWSNASERAACLAELERNGCVSNFEARLKLKGKELPHLISGRFIQMNGTTHVLWEFLDISELKMAQSAMLETNSRLQATLDAIPDLLFEVSADGRIANYHSPRTDLLAAPPEVFLGKTFADILPVDASAMISQALREADDTGESRGTQYALTLPQGVRWFELSILKRPDCNGLHGGYIMLARDITERKQTVSELARARDAANSANVAKSRFLATMSHEIRTPMNGILGMAQLLLTPNLQEKDRFDYARTIVNSGQTLLALLNDILDLSKVEAGKFDLMATAFDPMQIIRETQALFAETAADKGLRFEIGDFQPARQRYVGDPNRLRQMLANFASNAIKFTSSGFIRLEVREVERDPQQACLEFAVTDSGIGINAAQRKLLFQPFSQADNSNTRQYGGTGLGLSIVRSLANLMDGETGVESEAGRGSRFWFRIRVSMVSSGEESRTQDRPFTAPKNAPGQQSPLSGHILVVEDDPTNRKVIGALLHKIGLSSIFAEDGRKAVEAMQLGSQADLILMDLQMPVMDGYAATEQIRQWETTQGCAHHPVIALTADAFDETRQRCLACGMDDFLTKPVALNQLATALGRWLPAR